MRISDWSSDVCSSDLDAPPLSFARPGDSPRPPGRSVHLYRLNIYRHDTSTRRRVDSDGCEDPVPCRHLPGGGDGLRDQEGVRGRRSEEHTPELQSLIRNSSVVFCLKKKNHENNHHCILTQYTTTLTNPNTK